MENLINELKIQIKEALTLEDLSVEEFDENAPLFGDDGIGLDSIDALELIVLLERKYGIKLKDPSKGKEVFQSVNVMAKYIAENRTK